MDGSPSSIIMLGLGNGTFNGSPSLVLTLGLGVADVAATITGKWSDIEHIHADRGRTAIHADRVRIEVQG